MIERNRKMDVLVAIKHARLALKREDLDPREREQLERERTANERKVVRWVEREEAANFVAALNQAAESGDVDAEEALLRKHGEEARRRHGLA